VIVAFGLCLLSAIAACSKALPVGAPGGPTRADAGAAWSGARPVARALARRLPGRQAFQPLPSDVGRLAVTTLTGTRSGVTLKVWVWLPPEYDEPAFAHKDFPALMLFPGGTGAGHNAWAGTGLGAREVVASGAAHGSLSPFVFVMPEMQVSPALDTECADLPGEPRMGTGTS
jgi:hypothetical protein